MLPIEPSPGSLLPLLLLLPLCGAIANGLLATRLPRGAIGLVGNASVIGSFALSVAIVIELTRLPEGARISTNLYRWFEAGGFAVDLRFVVDRLSAVMILVVTGIGSLIHVYSLGYMAKDPSYGRYYAYLNLFIFSMLVLVLGDSLPLLFVGWEGVGLCSYLLIGFWFDDLEKAAAGKKAFIINRVGDIGLILAMAVLLRTTGALDFDSLRAASLGGMLSPAVATAAALLLLLGATGKSAQAPLHVWLPDAMAGPTPVSALIHAATMVTAGVYLIARLGFVFALAPTAMLTVAVVGAVTALFAATIATRQNDIKKVLAYSTISQLGFMFIAAGVGAYAVAILHLVTHAFFKACLFLGAGSVIHGLGGEQDIRKMGGLWRKMPITAATFVVAALAISGFPLLSGFVSKDAILWNAFIADAGAYAATFTGAAKILWAAGIATTALTSFYIWRLVVLVFFANESRARAHESPRSMTIPLLALGGGALVTGALAWPKLLGGAERLYTWLAPAVGSGPAPSGHFAALEWALAGMATLAALAGGLLAYRACRHGTKAERQRGALWTWLIERALARWHIDELYDTVVAKPTLWVAHVLLGRVLERIIDGAVYLVAHLARTIGVLAQLVQTGNIQKYLAVFVIALTFLLYGWLAAARAGVVWP